MEREDSLIANFKEFYGTAKRSFETGDFTVAYTLFYKALVTVADILVFKKRGIIPRNHKHRFEVLPYVDMELLGALSGMFEDYTKTYSSRMSQDDCKDIMETVEKYVLV